MIPAFAATLLDAFGFVGGPQAVALASGQSPALMMLAAIALTGMLVALLAAGARIAAAATALPLGGRAAALREKSWRAAFLPQRDPDAAGRARPRAPTAFPLISPITSAAWPRSRPSSRSPCWCGCCWRR